MPDSPAHRAGLQSGDLLTHIDGVRLDTKKGGGIFSKVVPGQSVEFEVERDGWTRDVVIVAEERPQTDSPK
jgi:serine protease DegS